MEEKEDGTLHKTQLCGEDYLKNFRQIIRTPSTPYAPSFVSGDESIYFELFKQLGEIRRKLEEITGLINAPRQGDYSLQSGVWRKWHSEKEQSK